MVDGKAVTTSRKIAQVLGRRHRNVLDTIKRNAGNPAFKYGNLSKRSYSVGTGGRWDEFLLTRRALDSLAGLMRRNAKVILAEAYADAWGAKPSQQLLLVPAEPEPKQAVTDVEALPEQAEQDDSEDQTRTLAKWVDELLDELRKTKDTLQYWAEEYADQKRRAKRNADESAYWHDLYEDIMLRLLSDKDVGGIVDAHLAFKKRISNR